MQTVLREFMDSHCFDYIMYLASESQGSSAEDFGDQLYAYISRHIECRLRNHKANKAGDRLLWQLLHDTIENVDYSTWKNLAVHYLEQFAWSVLPVNGNYVCPDPLQNLGGY